MQRHFDRFLRRDGHQDRAIPWIASLLLDPDCDRSDLDVHPARDEEVHEELVPPLRVDESRKVREQTREIRRAAGHLEVRNARGTSLRLERVAVEEGIPLL